MRFEPLEDRCLLSATVATDKPDYAPGETAYITGTGFALGETVELQVLHIDGAPNTGDGHEPWHVTDGFWTLDGTTEFAPYVNGAGVLQQPDLDRTEDGDFETTWYVNPDDSEHATFELTATGQTNGLVAQTTFTDTGNDSPDNITAANGWLTHNAGDVQTTTITAPAGQIITKIGIKTGSGGTFPIENLTGVPGDENEGPTHSPVIIADGTYGGYTVTGIGTGSVTVTNIGAAQGRGISHVDYFLEDAQTGSISWEKRTEAGVLQGGATFEVRAGTNDPSGALLVTVTDNQAGVDLDPTDGQIVIGNVPLGTYTVFETVAPAGYALDDDASRVVTVSAAELNPVIGSSLAGSGTDDTGNTDESDFHNRLGSISWEKRNETGTLQGGATFEVRAGTNDPSGALLVTVTDNQAGVDLDPTDGQIVIGNVPLGTYTVFETVAPAGYSLDDDASRVVTVSAAELNPVIGSSLAGSGTDDTGNTDESDFHNIPQPVPEDMDPIVVIGPDKGNTSQPIVKVVNKTTGAVLAEFFAYESTFLGGVRIATGDMDGDGFDEIITAPGPGRAPEIRVFTQAGVELTQFRTMAYATSFNKGVEVAIGDVNGDGKNDIVTAPTGGRTEVRVFFNNSPAADPIPNSPSKSFFVFPATFQGGADVIVADMGTFNNGAVIDATTPDGKAEIIVGSGPGLRAMIYVYDLTGATPKVVDTILPFSSAFKGGITLDAARVNADLIPDLIVAAGIGGNSAVQIWSGVTNDGPDVLLHSFTTFTDVTTYNAPVHATAIDTDGDGIADLIAVVQGTNGKSNEIRCFEVDGTPVSTLSNFVGPWNITTLRKPKNTIA